MSHARLASALVALLALRAAAEDDVTVIADAETELGAKTVRASRCEAARVPLRGKDAGHAIRWTVAAGTEVAHLGLRDLPDDIRPYRRLCFRVRAVKPTDEYVEVIFRGGEDPLFATLPAVGREWREVMILLPEMRTDDGFDPEGVYALRFVCWNTPGLVLEIDDVRLEKDEGGWRYSAEERAALGIDPKAETYRVADFERDAWSTRLSTVRSRAERVPLPGRGGGFALRWETSKGASGSWLNLVNVPIDVRPYRELRFRARAAKPVRGDLTVSLWMKKGRLEAPLPKLSGKWREVRLLLPEMAIRGDFDPEELFSIRFRHDGDRPAAIGVDDVVLVKGPGGWEKSEEQRIIDVFGAERLRKVKRIETDHFVVLTDSAAARKKFPAALESIHDFVRKKLGLPEMTDKPPIYIFQSSKHYHDFCVRRGWSLEDAVETGGHAMVDYFATYYQAPEASVVTHELTHLIVMRTIGEGGGSWFHEGTAVYVQWLWEKRNAAREFASRLRGGRFVTLKEFMEIASLLDVEEVRGGPRSPDALYLQAGAFFEFLLRGPYAERASRIIRTIAALDEDEENVPAKVARILGKPLADVEKDWVAWGKKPPEKPEED